MFALGRRERAFDQLLGLLRTIEADRDDLASVLELNGAILKQVLLSERSIRRHKAVMKAQRVSLKTGKQGRAASKALRAQIKRAEEYIDAYMRQRWLWRLFGDALAFIYLDKFSIKHAFFETERFEIKRDAGMIDGKDGLVAEVGVLLDANKHGVPGVLCDLTNILRYGDVCLLGGSDPFPIEVKSSKGLNQRGKRQAETLERLHGFLENDHAPNFRGALGETRRVSITVEERTHVEAFNRCIREAEVSGQAIVGPEPGLRYAAIYGDIEPDYEAIFSGSGSRTIAFSWNDDKNNCAWAPYVPFLLTIRESKHLLDFVEGRLFLIVMADVDRLCGLMCVDGWTAKYEPNAVYPVQCFHAASQATMGLSSQFVARIGYECCSLGWVAESQVAAMQSHVEYMGSQYGPFQPIDVEHAIRQLRFGPDA